jgi:hypothetical protein
MFIFPFLGSPQSGLTLGSAHLKKGKAPGERLPALTPVPNDDESGRNLATQSNQFAATRNRGFQFHKRGYLLIRGYNSR